VRRNPDRVYDLTAKGNLVAIVTDGSAVLGLGNIGPQAALPVMEGKAVLFSTLGGVEAFPICLATQDTDEIVEIVKAIAPTFGGINLEDIAAPRCFEIEAKLQAALDIPIFHDDQHGTAVVALAALINALKLADKRMEDVRIVINGSGAAGVAVAKLLLKYGVGDIILCDTTGSLYRGRTERMNRSKDEIAAMTNKDCLAGKLEQVITGADVFIGLSAPGSLTQAMIAEMNADPIIFALANPTPEIDPQLAMEAGALVIATGRSDYPNQVNNSLAFPGIFRGALDAKARVINDEMKIAAAEAIASLVGSQLRADFIIPDSISLEVPPKVAAAVARAAAATGEARVDVDPDAIEKRTFGMLYEGVTE
jgi:malate dehydrogenase (oxaloacetate-decarboxylating)